jgi:hypothetical protein
MDSIGVLIPRRPGNYAFKAATTGTFVTASPPSLKAKAVRALLRAPGSVSLIVVRSIEVLRREPDIAFDRA